jgi:uncharacterized protein (DUF1800 family)
LATKPQKLFRKQARLLLGSGVEGSSLQDHGGWMRKAIAIGLSWIFQLAGFACLLVLSHPAARDQVGFAAKQRVGSDLALSEHQRIVHLLNRAGFGPRPGDVEKVQQMGVERYLESQLRPSKVDDPSVEAKLKSLRTLTMSSAELIANYPRPRQNPNLGEQRALGEKSGGDLAEPEDRQEIRSMGLNGPRRVIGELAQAKILCAVYSERQLYEVMVDFWANHFNVFAAKGANKWLTTAYDRDVIRPHALGKFKNLLAATAKSPAMLFYLDNWMSVGPNVTLDFANMQESRRQDEGLTGRKGFGSFWRLGRKDPTMDQDVARQLQKKTSQGKQRRGLNENYARELMELHTLGVDGGYTQKDITEVARCFTGWTIARPRQGGEFFFARFLHDDEEKRVLGHNIKAGGGIRDGEFVLDVLVRHPSTAKFIAAKLVRRFVADEPPQSLVNQVAEVFRETDGDIAAMLRGIFTSPEFNSPEVYRAKVKTPFELVVSAIRAVGAETNGGFPILKAVAEMGEPLFLCQPPTGYADTADAWVNTGALLQRLNFGLALAGNRLPGTRVNLAQFSEGTAGNDREDLVKRLGEVILQGDISDQTLAALQRQLEVTGGKEEGFFPGEGSLGPAKIAGLLLGSPEFQRQ